MVKSSRILTGLPWLCAFAACAAAALRFAGYNIWDCVLLRICAWIRLLCPFPVARTYLPNLGSGPIRASHLLLPPSSKAI